MISFTGFVHIMSFFVQYHVYISCKYLIARLILSAWLWDSFFSKLSISDPYNMSIVWRNDNAS